MDPEFRNAESLHRELRERVGFDAVDGEGNRLGTVDIVVEDEVGRNAFLGIRTGVLGFSRLHLVPAYLTGEGRESHQIKLPFGRSMLKKAPAIDGEFEWNERLEAAVYAFFRTLGYEAPSPEAPVRV